MEEFFTLTYFKNFFKSPTKRRLAENFFSLSTLQALNYLLPLITLPYLVRVLGATKYGLIAFAQAFIGYFQILTDYGFNLSATREISINRENKEKISEIFSSVMIIKFCLLFASLLLMSAIVFSFSKFRQDWPVYYLTFGMVLGQVLFPVWFFQGMERMKYITFLNIIARGIFTICIFLFIKKMENYFYVPLINSLGYLVAGGLSLGIVFKKFGIKFQVPNIQAIKYQLKQGWHVFISLLAISLYTTSRIFIVGIFTNNTITGYYAIAEKLMNVIQTFPLASFLQAIYPRLVEIYAVSRKKAYYLMRKLQNVTIIVYLFLLLFLFYFADVIIEIITGSKAKETILALRILLVALFFINSNAFRAQFLIVSGNYRAYSKIYVTVGISGLILLTILTYFYSYVGTAVGISMIELIALMATLKYLKNIKSSFLENTKP